MKYLSHTSITFLSYWTIFWIAVTPVISMLDGRLFSLFILILTLPGLWFMPKNLSFFSDFRWSYILFWIFSAYIVVTLPMAKAPLFTLRHIAPFWVYATFPLFYASFIRLLPAKEKARVLFAFFIGCIVAYILFLINIRAGVLDHFSLSRTLLVPSWLWHQPHLVAFARYFDEPIQMEMMFWVWIGLAMLKWPRRQWSIFGVGWIVFALTIVQSNGQSGVIGHVMGLFLFLLAYFLPKITRWLISIGTAVFALIFIPVTTWLYHIPVFFYHLDGPDQDRLEIWDMTGYVIKKNVLLGPHFFGYGFGASHHKFLDVTAAGLSIVPGLAGRPRGILFHPHNMWLLLLFETGIIGAILVYLLLFMLFRFFTTLSPLKRATSYAIYAVTMVPLLSLMGLWHSVVVAFPVILCGMLIALYPEKTNTSL